MTHRLLKTAAALLALAPATVLAQDFPSEPPQGGEPKDFSLPDIETYTLDNGMDVTLVPYGNVPKAHLRAVLRVGNINDGEDRYLADVTNDMLVEGAAGMTAREMAEMAAMMGGQLSISTGIDRSNLTIDVLSDSVPDAIGLLAGVLRDPTLPADELAKVKQNQVRSLSVARTQPQTMASIAFDGILYDGHPYGLPLPSDEQIQGYTIEDVERFHAENYGGARTHLYVVGRFDERAVRRAVKAAFGEWDEGPEPLALPAPENDARQIVLIDREGAPQSTIRLGKRVPPVDQTLDLEAADTLLGGYFSSRITRNIREDKGYTYSPGSFVNLNKDAADWQQNADVQTASTGPALAEILREIIRLQGEVPPTDEVEGIKNYMNGIFVIRLASRAGMAGQLSFVDFHELGTAYLENYVGRVQALTPQDIQDAARTHLDIGEMSLVVVGDLAEVRPQLEALPLFRDALPPAATE
jgi:predicted Zn-dependent peptidase